MSDSPFNIERTFNASAETIWKAISDKDEMKKWYFTLDAFEARVGFDFSFPGKGSKGETYIHLCKVTEVVPLKKLSYSWCYKGHEGYSEVTFELFEEGYKKTRVRLTHRGLESFPKNNPDFAPASFEKGWTQLIGTLLKNFVEA